MADERNLADEFMPPSARIGDAEARRQGLMVPRLEDLSTEPPAGPTVMEKAHVNGMRKAIARVKPYLGDRKDAPDALRVAMLTYLLEWQSMYAQGAREAVMPTERVIIQIRQDTMAQLAAELAKPTS